jgi:hypothetical protein
LKQRGGNYQITSGLSTENFSRFRMLDEIGAPAQAPRRTLSEAAASTHNASPGRVMRRVACNMKAEWLYLKQICDFPAMLLASLSIDV